MATRKYKVEYYTHNFPPVGMSEPKSALPSETRESDDMDIKETIARFFRAGGVIPTQQGSQDLTVDEKEALFDSVTEQDLMDADLTEQSQFVTEIQGQLNSSQVQEKQTETEEKKEVNEPTDSAKAE